MQIIVKILYFGQYKKRPILFDKLHFYTIVLSMKKDDLHYNLNSSPMTKGIILGAGVAVVLLSIPSLVAHPNAPEIITLLLSGGISYDAWRRLKDQMAKNEGLLKEHKIKDYKNPTAWALNTSLFGLMTISTLPSSIDKQHLFEIFTSLLSLSFFIPSLLHLRKDLNHNEKLIEKVR